MYQVLFNMQHFRLPQYSVYSSPPQALSRDFFRCCASFCEVVWRLDYIASPEEITEERKTAEKILDEVVIAYLICHLSIVREGSRRPKRPSLVFWKRLEHSTSRMPAHSITIMLTLSVWDREQK
jgi:hypothetical protein